MFRAFAACLIGLVLSTSALADSAGFGVAVSLKEAITQVGKDYETVSGNTVTFTFGSSGQILTQIKSGAPLDGFISAANQQVDTAIMDGLADASSRRVVVSNSLVLIVPASSTLQLVKFEDLTSPGVKRIAVGEPKTVPCGLYTLQTLTSLKIADRVKDRVTYASNVRQVLDYVQRGEVDAGAVYLTDAIQAGNAVKVVATADPSLHEPIVYPAVILKNAPHSAVATGFLDYLRTDKARAVLKAHGFSVPVTGKSDHE